MSRRAREPEEFGSDSFLDVLANIVGILIILIVSAAARVERGPVVAPTSAAADEAEPSSEPGPSAPLAMEPDPAVDMARVEPQAVPESAPEPEPELGPDVAPPEITAELAAVQKKLSSLD